MIVCVAYARALSVCRKRRGKKKNYPKRRARAIKKNEGASYRSASLSLSLFRGGGMGGEFFFDLGPEKQKLRVVRYIYVYVRM